MLNCNIGPFRRFLAFDIFGLRAPAQSQSFGLLSGTYHSRKENRSSLVISGLRRLPAQIRGFGSPSGTHHSRTENRSSLVISGLPRLPAQIRGFGSPSGTYHSRTENRSSLVISGSDGSRPKFEVLGYPLERIILERKIGLRW